MTSGVEEGPGRNVPRSVEESRIAHGSGQANEGRPLPRWGRPHGASRARPVAYIFFPATSFESMSIVIMKPFVPLYANGLSPPW